MENIKTKKAMEVIKEYEEYYEEVCQIFKGCPDARYKKGYYVYAGSWHGLAAVGMYGQMLAYSKSLKGLIDILEEGGMEESRWFALKKCS